MADITLTGRKVTITDAMRASVDDKIGGALKVFDISPMSCDVVLRVDGNRSNQDRKACEVTVYVRDNVVRVVSSGTDIDSCIDDAAGKVSRQLRKYKTRIIDKRPRTAPAHGHEELDLSSLIETGEDDVLVREKTIELIPMTEEEALVQTDLIGHDFYVFENSKTGLINVIYHRKDGGYGIIKPKIEEIDG